MLTVAFISHSAASELKQEQFQAVVANLHLGEDGYSFKVYTGAEFQSQMQEDISSTEQSSGESASCQQLQGLVSEFTAGTSPFNVPDLTVTWDSFLMLTDNEEHAGSIVEPWLKCFFREDATKIYAQSENGVSLSIWESYYSTGHDLRAAVYKNVVMINNYRIDDDTRAQWQTYATTTFKSAVDQAIKS